MLLQCWSHDDHLSYVTSTGGHEVFIGSYGNQPRKSSYGIAGLGAAY